MRSLLVLAMLAALFAPAGHADSEVISVTKLSAHAFVLKSNDYGTNVGLLKTTKGIVLIDPMPGDAHLDALDRTVRTLAGEPASFILNTHGHGDHSGGNAFFSGKGGVLVDDVAPSAGIHGLSARSHASTDRIFYHRQSNSIFVGDIYDTSWHPTFYAGGVSGFNDAIEAILALGDDDSIIVPGHGKPTGKAELRAFRKHTLDWVARVGTLKRAGMTAIEMKDDAQLKAILETFNRENKADFMPDRAFVRFIERTLELIDKEA